jgi:hypothetical protein
MAYSSPTRTAGEAMQAVKRAFGDESGVQLEDTDLIGWINDAQDEIVKRNRVLKATSTTNSVAGQAAYTFPSMDILQIESIHYDGRLLRNLSFVEAERFLIDPTNTDSGEPWLWYEWEGTFTMFPTPPTVKEIKVYYTKVPTPVVDLSSVLSVPDKYYQYVLQYVLQQAYEMDEDLQASQMKGQQFTEGLAVLNEEERTAQNMTYSVINVVD